MIDYSSYKRLKNKFDIILTMGNCFSKKEHKIKKRQLVLTESVDEEYKFSIPSKLSTIIEEKTIDINVTCDKI